MFFIVKCKYDLEDENFDYTEFDSLEEAKGFIQDFASVEQTLYGVEIYKAEKVQ